MIIIVYQYKNLFPTELSKFKIKVNATEKELQIIYMRWKY